MEHFTHLGSVISNDTTVSKDLDNRLSKASSSFGKLSKRVWQSHLLRLSTKIPVYWAVVVPTLRYGAETMLFFFFSETDEGLHPWHQMTRPRVKRRSPQESQPAQHRSSPSCFRCSCAGLALSQGWKTYVCPKQSSSASSKKERAIVVLQKSLQRAAEKTACVGGSQPSVMAAGGLIQRQLVLVSEKTQFTEA